MPTNDLVSGAQITNRVVSLKNRLGSIVSNFTIPYYTNYTTGTFPTSETYSLESTYPYSIYDVEICVSSNATSEQFDMASKAKITPVNGSNSWKCLGDTPTSTIPIIIKYTRK